MTRSATLGALLALGAGTALAISPGLQPDPGMREKHTMQSGTPADAGEVPPAVLARARELLGAEHVAAPAVLMLVESVTWPDGGLGCGRPGEIHTQALVRGYRLVYAAGQRRYEFHASLAGLVVACDRNARLPAHPAPLPEPHLRPDPGGNPSE